jgi:hypothetical protein
MADRWQWARTDYLAVQRAWVINSLYEVVVLPSCWPVEQKYCRAFVVMTEKIQKGRDLLDPHALLASADRLHKPRQTGQSRVAGRVAAENYPAPEIPVVCR